MIKRTLAPHLVESARRFPVVTLTGPRQSGKTTLCRAAFPAKPYVSLEAPDIRAYAADDPRSFLAEHRDGAIVDEVQRVPELLSYLQGEVDARPVPGRFILTGSANLGLLRVPGDRGLVEPLLHHHVASALPNLRESMCFEYPADVTAR